MDDRTTYTSCSESLNNSWHNSQILELDEYDPCRVACKGRSSCAPSRKMPGDDLVVDEGDGDEVAGESWGLSVKLSRFGVGKFGKVGLGVTAGHNNCEGEPEPSPKSELTSLLVIAGVSKVKPWSLKLSQYVRLWSQEMAELLYKPKSRYHWMSSRNPDPSFSKWWSLWFSGMLWVPRQCSALQHYFWWSI